MEIIVTHNNCDFDGLASAWALSMLKPFSKLYIPSSSSNVKKYISLHMDEEKFITGIDITLFTPTRIYVVDTKKISKLDYYVQRLISNSPVEVEIYDHHVWNKSTILKGTIFEEEIGACTTLLVEKIFEKGIKISRDDATLFLLGIFEETGKLTYSGTTYRDAEISAKLIKSGARLFTLRQFIDEKMDERQLLLYRKSINSVRKIIINGVSIHISTFSMDEFISGLDIVAKKMRMEEKYKCLIIIAGMGKNVYLVGRNNSNFVNLPAIISLFNGGGHKFAAAASIKNSMSGEIEKILLEKLPDYVKKAPTAKDIMECPVKTIPFDSTIREAKIFLDASTHGLLIVLDDDKNIAGILNGNDINKAIHHKLHNSKISHFFVKEPITVSPDATLDELYDYFAIAGFNSLPVTDGLKLKGIIKRKNFLTKINYLSDNLYNSINSPVEEREKMVEKIEKFLEFKYLSLLKDIGRLSVKYGINLYLVGGIVRDIILGIKSKDVDIIAEDGKISTVEFFRYVAERMGGKLNEHKKFKTATMTLYDGTIIDFSTARSEFYEHPASLPLIENGSLETDLARRDFTINAIAVSINGENFGQIYDPYRGISDIKKKLIRILPNSLSFIEDPQRIFRAIRFSSRLHFDIEKETLLKLKYAVNLELIKKVDLSRIRDELILIFSEKNSVSSIITMVNLGIFDSISPSITIDNKRIKYLRYVEDSLIFLRKIGIESKKWIVFIIIILSKMDDKEIEQLLLKMHINKKIINGVRLSVKNFEKCYELLNYEIITMEMWWENHKILMDLDENGFCAIISCGKSKIVRKNLKYYLENLKNIKNEIGGEELIKMGLTPGPVFKKIIDEIKKSKFLGIVKNREEELKLMEKMVYYEKNRC